MLLFYYIESEYKKQIQLPADYRRDDHFCKMMPSIGQSRKLLYLEKRITLSTIISDVRGPTVFEGSK